jgi:hypothetical protein
MRREPGPTSCTRPYQPLTAAVTATTAHNQPTGLTAATDQGEVEASELGLSLN